MTLMATRWEQLLAERRRACPSSPTTSARAAIYGQISTYAGSSVVLCAHPAGLWELFVLRSGWTPDAYGQWMAMVAADSLLELPTNTTPPWRKIHLVLSVGDSHLHGTAPDRH